jgi:transcriptional regulator with XRE-family HTH domain
MFHVGQNLRFAEWLQSEIDKRGWSQSDCARAAELNRAVINKLLNSKSKPQPLTLIAIARALKIPIEMVYRAAGLLPPSLDGDDTLEELIHTFRSIQSPQRRATAVMLLKALVTEEENERHGSGQKGRY